MVARLVARLRSPSTVYLAASVLGRIGSFVLIPLYVRRLSSADYGEYALSQSLMVIGPPIFALGLNNAFTKFQFERTDESSPGLAGTVARWTIIVTAIAATLVAALVLAVHPSGGGLRGTHGLLCVIAAVAGSAIHSIPLVYFRNEQRPYAASALQLFELLVVTTFGSLFVGPLGRGLDGALEGCAAAYGVCASIGLVLILRMPADPLDRKVLRSALAFSTPLVPHYLAVWLQGAGDRWVLEFAGQQARLGPYSLASQVTAPSVMIMSSWNTEQSARLGVTYRYGGLRGLAERLPRLVRLYVLAVLVASAAVVVILPLVPLLAGRLSAEAILYVGPVLAIGAIDWLYCPYQLVAYYTGHSKRIAAVTIASAITNVGLSIVMVPIIGVWGAVSARAGATILKTAGMWWVARRILRGTDGERAGELADPPATSTGPEVAPAKSAPSRS